MTLLDRIEGRTLTRKKLFYLTALPIVAASAFFCIVWRIHAGAVTETGWALVIAALWASIVQLSARGPLFGTIGIEAFIYSPSIGATAHIVRQVPACLLEDVGGFFPDALLLVLSTELPQGALATDWRWATAEEVERFHATTICMWIEQ